MVPHGSRIVAISILAFTASAGMAQTTTVNLSGGWQASWDSSLDSFVSIIDDGVFATTDDAGGPTTVQIIEKSAEFTQPPPFPGFPFPTIPITFTQTRADASPFIAIDDEILTNSTGLDWTGFEMQLLDHGDVAWDPARTLASGGGGPLGFSISPFTTAAFSGDLQTFLVGGGVIPDGGQWFPGSGATDGLLWIAIDTGAGTPDDPFTTFTLKETPTPTAPTMALLALGGLGVTRRRR